MAACYVAAQNASDMLHHRDNGIFISFTVAINRINDAANKNFKAYLLWNRECEISFCKPWHCFAGFSIRTNSPNVKTRVARITHCWGCTKNIFIIYMSKYIVNGLSSLNVQENFILIYL